MRRYMICARGAEFEFEQMLLRDKGGFEVA